MVKDDGGQVVGQRECNIIVVAASRAVSITTQIAELVDGPVPTTAPHLLPDVGADVGSQEHDAAVLVASQDLAVERPQELQPPSVEGHPLDIVEGCYRLFLDRAVADERVQDRFGEADYKLFKQHRFEKEGGTSSRRSCLPIRTLAGLSTVERRAAVGLHGGGYIGSRGPAPIPNGERNAGRVHISAAYRTGGKRGKGLQ